jgi:hypothetical protein
MVGKNYDFAKSHSLGLALSVIFFQIIFIISVNFINTTKALRHKNLKYFLLWRDSSHKLLISYKNNMNPLINDTVL